jgi:hypothetical protein
MAGSPHRGRLAYPARSGPPDGPRVKGFVTPLPAPANRSTRHREFGSLRGRPDKRRRGSGSHTFGRVPTHLKLTGRPSHHAGCFCRTGLTRTQTVHRRWQRPIVRSAWLSTTSSARMLAQTDDLRLTTALEQPDQSSPLGGSIHSASSRAGAWRAAPRRSSGFDRDGSADRLLDRVDPVCHRVSL